MIIKRLFNRLRSPDPFELEEQSIPSFLIIGVQKGGTTSLYEYLQQHPQVRSALTKEVHFFDLNFAKGWEWYLEQLGQPLDGDAELVQRTGEASPYYVFHPLVPERVFRRAPNIKLILLLRDPVARSLSHYHHECRWQFESLPLEDALEQEEQRLSQELNHFARDPHYESYAYQHYSYIKRSLYLEQIRAWARYFSPSQILIIQSEFFCKKPSLTLNCVSQFLELDKFDFSPQVRHNAGHYPQAPSGVKQRLAQIFSEPNRELLAYLEKHWPAENLIGFGPGEVNWLMPTPE